MKKIGIICDNYKVTRFFDLLAKDGYTQLEQTIFVGDTTILTIYVPDEKYNDAKKRIAAISIQVENHFKRSN